MQNNSWNYGNLLNQNGEILIGESSSNPKATFFTSSAQTIAYVYGPGTINIEVNSFSPFVNPLAVASGGSGQASLIFFGVLVGEGSNGVDVTAAGINGEVLIASTTGDPQFTRLTSTGNTITFKIGYNSLNLEANFRNNTFFNPLLVVNGGTGRTILTTYGVLVGEGSNRVDVTTAGTNGQVLIASTTGDPKFAAITSTGNTLTFTVGVNSLNINVNLANSFFNPVQVANGGLGRTVLTAYGVLIGEGSNQIRTTGTGINGQLLIASSTGDPKFARITSTGGSFTFTFGYNSLNVDVAFSSNPLWNPLPVTNGGTGRTVLTRFGVLIGEGSNQVRVTGAGTNGQLLIASSSGDPKFGTITSTGGSFTFTFGYNSLNIDLAFSSNPFWNPLRVANGGTGRTVLTIYGVLIGEGSNSIRTTGTGTNGRVLIASTTGDPKFVFITSTGGSISFTFGYNSLNADVSFASSAFFNPLQVVNGGTGQTILTIYGVLIGEGSNDIHATASGTNGQTLIASSTDDPKFMLITSSGGSVTFTVGCNSLNMDVDFASSIFLDPLEVVNGGTGQTVLTTYGVLLGEGSNQVHVTAAGTNGQTLIASSSGDPQFAMIDSGASSLTFLFTPGYNSLNIETTPLAGLPYPILAINGATGRTVLTAYGVLVGEGSNRVDVITGTNGQVIIASSSGDPQFAMISSSGGAVSFTSWYNTLNIDVSITGSIIPLPINGATGLTVLTLYGVLIGEGSNDVNVTDAGTNGQLLIASSTGDPQFATITSSGGSFAFTYGYNSLNMEFVFVGVNGVSTGGTGETVLTLYGVLIGEGSNNVNVTAAGTDGQLLIASSSGDPQFATITSAEGTFTFTFGHNSLNMEFVEIGIDLVPSGGTGRSVLTTFGVLIGEGSNNVNVTDPGNNGETLIASSSGDPQFLWITSSAGSITFTFGYNSLNMEGVRNAVITPVIAGGTSRSVLTTFGVLVGEGSRSVNVTAAGTNGQILVASSTGDPAFFTISSTKGSFAFRYGYNSLNIDLILPVGPSFGGTGNTVLSTYGVLIGEGSNNVNITAPGTDGQILLAGNGQDPQFASITSTGGSIAFTVGHNSLNMEALLSTKINTVRGGGTGRTVLTTYGILIGEGSNNVDVIAGLKGQILIASSTGNPLFASVTSTGGTITFTTSSNSLNMEVAISSQVNPVRGRGTGRSILTTFGVLIGEGSKSVNVTAPGTHGQTLIAMSTGDPAFARITSSGGTLTFQVGPNSLNIDLAIILSSTYGGTNRTVLTLFGVLVGEGSNGVNVTAAGTDGQVLIASSTGDPKFSSLTSTGGSLTFTFGPNSLNIDYVTTSALIPVNQGGTGRTVLTNHGVLVGEGSLPINATPAGTNGQLLIASTSGDPRFSSLTSTGNTLAFSAGINSLNIDINSPVVIGSGGTGRTVLTTFGVLLGEGSLSLQVTAAGTDGQLLIASATGNPRFSSVTSTGGTITFTSGSHSLNMEIIVTSQIVSVAGGGTGRTVLTTFGVLLGEGSNSIQVTAAGSNGQVLIASGSGNPKFSRITSTGGTITFTFGVNSLNLDLDVGGFTFLNPWPVELGGTGKTVLTTFGVLIGEGSNDIQSTNAGTDGQLFLAATGANPKFNSVTSTGSSIALTSGPGSLNIDINGSLDPNFGGTGRTVLTTFGVMLGEGLNAIDVTAAGTNGQVLIAGTGVDPQFSAITSTGNTITFKIGRNSLNFELNTRNLSTNVLRLINFVSGNSASSLVQSISTSFNYYLVDTTNGTVTLQFPESSTNGQSWVVKDLSGATDVNPIIIATASGTMTFDGQSTFNLLNPFGALQILYSTQPSPSHYELF